MQIKMIDIWKGINDQISPRPRLTTYIHSGEKSRGIVLILPGGGYQHTSSREAEPVALKFLNEGYHAVVLDYSVAPHRFPQALQDSFRALTIIRDNSNSWHVDLNKIFICGFSAGGHLGASISNLYKTESFSHYDGVNIKGLDIKGTILSYPVITSGEFAHKDSFINLFGNASDEVLKHLSMEYSVNHNTPKTFLWHTADDSSVPVENSILYARALQEKNIPFELHIFPTGVHGLSLATEETAERIEHVNQQAAQWLKLCFNWMKTHDK